VTVGNEEKKKKEKKSPLQFRRVQEGLKSERAAEIRTTRAGTMVLETG